MSLLRQPINSVNIQVLWRNKFNLLLEDPNFQTDMIIISSYVKVLYLGKLTSPSPKSKLKDFMRDYFSFFIGKSHCTA